KLCAARKMEQAAKLIDDALLREQVIRNPAQLRLLVGLQQQLREIPKYHERLNSVFETYYAQAATGDRNVLEVIQAQLEDNRRDMSRSIGQVSRAIHSGTRDSAVEARALERRAQIFSWTITAIACTLGLLFAAWVTRQLVRPVRALVSGTQAIEKGDLNVRIEVRTRDEIGQLAGSFNHMVGELRQKEQDRKSVV